MVAGMDVPHTGPDGLHDTGTFVTEHEGPVGRPLASGDVEVRVAHAARAQPHSDQVVPHLRQTKLLGTDWLARPGEDPRAYDAIGQTEGAPEGSPSRACSLARTLRISAPRSSERLNRK